MQEMTKTVHGLGNTIYSSFATWREARLANRETRPVAFVPTMGALHAGHAALIRRARVARESGCEVVVSVYVNPTQFNDPEDFDAYPTVHEQDAALAFSAGADTVVFPTALELYPSGVPKRAEVVNYGGLTNLWEGANRPGHFDGVVAVVRSLFAQVQPECAFFGEKDWQQLAVIQRLAKTEFVGLDIVAVSTERESNGLARSSRNARLSELERKRAGKLHAVMLDVANAEDVLQALDNAQLTLKTAGFELEYLALVDEVSMCVSLQPKPSDRLIVAANFCGVRLIDNLSLADTCP